MRAMNHAMTGTLARWLTGPRVAGLPAPAAMPAPRLSFEFFPPKTEKLEEQLWACIRRLEPLGPRFVSVTYGAGGTTQERTHATVARLVAETSLTPAAHLTCVGATRDEVDAVARQYWEAGVRHIVALRGDPPAGASGYTPHPGGYAQAEDLVRGLKRIGDFEISVGAYPEMHPAAVSAEADLDFLKRKIDAGATRAITQYFFDADVYLRFLGPLPGGGHHGAHRARHHAGDEFRQRAALLGDVRRQRAGLDGPVVRGPGRGCRDAADGGGHGGGGAGAPAAGEWRG
jgi:methylenetetrahydrofolate reductase (NADPH)